MEGYFKPEILVPVVAGLLFVVGWYIYKKYGKKGKEEELSGELTASTKKPLPVRVYHNRPLPAHIEVGRMLTVEEQDEIITRCGSLGQIVNHYGAKTLSMYEDEDGKLNPKPQPATFVRSHPRKLYNDIRQPAADLVYGELLEEEKNVFEKYGKVFWWLAVIAFIMFMIISSMPD